MIENDPRALERDFETVRREPKPISVAIEKELMGPSRSRIVICTVAAVLSACGATATVPADTSMTQPTVTGAESSPAATDLAPKTVADAGVDAVQPLSQIDALDDGWWIDGFAGLESGRTYISLGEPPVRTRGQSDRCPDATWIDERDGLEGIIEFESSGVLETTFSIFAAYETDYLLAKPTCLHIAGDYTGVSGDVAGSSGTYTIVWGTGNADRSIRFDGG